MHYACSSCIRAQSACRVTHVTDQECVSCLQKEVEQQSETVQRMLHSASTGAAKVVARKTLDTLKREAVAFEELPQGRSWTGPFSLSCASGTPQSMQANFPQTSQLRSHRQ